METTIVKARRPINAAVVGCVAEWRGGAMLGLVRLGEAWMLKGR
jgi:hypothetical protein